jgi:hypothetical protein
MRSLHPVPADHSPSIQGNAMKLLLSAIVACLLWLSAAEACAQFTQPPPRSTPPTCSRLKDGGFPEISKSDCKLLHALPNVDIMLECETYIDSVLCHAGTYAYDGVQWELLDPSTLTHGWSFIVDGQESHLSPNNQDVVAISCGSAGYGYVRVAVWNAVVQAEFQCQRNYIPSW